MLCIPIGACIPHILYAYYEVAQTRVTRSPPINHHARITSTSIPFLVLSLDNVVSDCKKGSRPVAEGLEGLLGLVDQPPCLLLGSLETEELGVGGLIGVQVLGCGLPEVLGRCGDVKDVVRDLEREPESGEPASLARQHS